MHQCRPAEDPIYQKNKQNQNRNLDHLALYLHVRLCVAQLCAVLLAMLRGTIWLVPEFVSDVARQLMDGWLLPRHGIQLHQPSQ